MKWQRPVPDAIERHWNGLTLDTMGLPRPMLVAAKLLPQPSLHAARKSNSLSTYSVARKRSANSVILASSRL